MSNTYTDQNMRQMEDFKDEINDLLGKDETVWLQCSRVQWLKERDHNTNFFHTTVSVRKKKNKINRL